MMHEDYLYVIDDGSSDQIGDSSEPESGSPILQTELSLWKHSISVHESLPIFILQLHGEGDVFTGLSIIDSSAGTVVYEIDLTETGGILKERFMVEAIDMDFDGYRDIDIFTGSGGTWKQNHLYIMWSPETGNFTGDIHNLASLGLPKFDADKKLVYSMQRGSAIDHWDYMHKYIDGVLTVIEETATNNVWLRTNEQKEQVRAVIPIYDESHTLIHYYRKALDESTMQLQTVEEAFRLYIPNEWELIAEYDGDSEVGRVLKEMID